MICQTQMVSLNKWKYQHSTDEDSLLESDVSLDMRSFQEKFDEEVRLENINVLVAKGRNQGKGLNGDGNGDGVGEDQSVLYPMVQGETLHQLCLNTTYQSKCCGKQSVRWLKGDNGDEKCQILLDEDGKEVRLNEKGGLDGDVMNSELVSEEGKQSDWYAIKRSMEELEYPSNVQRLEEEEVGCVDIQERKRDNLGDYYGHSFVGHAILPCIEGQNSNDGFSIVEVANTIDMGSDNDYGPHFETLEGVKANYKGHKSIGDPSVEDATTFYGSGLFSSIWATYFNTGGGKSK